MPTLLELEEWLKKELWAISARGYLARLVDYNPEINPMSDGKAIEMGRQKVLSETLVTPEIIDQLNSFIEIQCQKMDEHDLVDMANSIRNKRITLNNGKLELTTTASTN